EGGVHLLPGGGQRGVDVGGGQAEQVDADAGVGAGEDDVAVPRLGRPVGRQRHGVEALGVGEGGVVRGGGAGGSQREGEADATLAELAMLLTDAERSALAGSAVLHGGFTRDAAEAVVGMDLALLSALLDRSLLRSEEHTSELQSRENLVCRLLL